MALQEGFVMLISSDGLGRGDDELGRLLMQRFLHELGGVDRKPDEMLFLNNGVKLVVDESPVLEQLRRLEAQGVELRACSTCLDRFGLTDRVAVGNRTNMGDIAGTFTRAGKVVTL